MDIQPNCPRCKNERFAKIEHVLYNFVNQNDKKEYARIIDFICCDKCGAVICQYDAKASREKLI